MHRRDLLAGAALLPFALARRPAWAGSHLAAQAEPFSADLLRRRARQLAATSFRPPDAALPAPFDGLDYNAFRAIEFRREETLWRAENSRLGLQLFHRGFLYRAPVEVYEVANGEARRIRYSPDLFRFGEIEPPADLGDLGFSGLRLTAPVHGQGTTDEFAVFQGASYFRALASGLTYGLSARGLAVRTGDPRGEEFPVFRAFWVERPAAPADAVVLHALLDGESVTGAYRFVVTPGESTVMDVEATLYPRSEIDQPGLAPLTSMYHFAPNDRVGIDDFRGAVHDSDALVMRNGRGESIWRPLTNPSSTELSSFLDIDPRGFGLVQRRRDYADYRDLIARYHQRPSLWVEPVGRWGEGAVQLIEMPTRSEYHDNIVAFWRPSAPLAAGEEVRLAYRLHWGWDTPAAAPDLAHFSGVYVGAADPGLRFFVVEAQGGALDGLDPDAEVDAEVTASGGEIIVPSVRFNPESGGRRLVFTLRPHRAATAEIRAELILEGRPVSEIMVYRWGPE